MQGNILQPLVIYNTLTRAKELFEPINPPFVGMYVCGPTVYSDVHLGNCRTFISFDLIYRYLLHIGYKVRYVRNITDAGHLEGDNDEGDDKFAKKAKLEQLEPMEIVQKYTLGFHEILRIFNTLPPSIEPTATGHIVEQIEMVKKILDAGYAYEIDGTVYFDVEKYNREYPYGVLTNRKLEELLEGTRELGGQDEKRGRLDFALWIKAKPETLMKWPSPWGWGFPGWHIECSAMSTKYLGTTFDIHGGGMDLQATHHTNEIAQSQACHHTAPVKYWVHTNMLTVNGARMSKTAGNGFLPRELFTGDHPLLERGYSPMTVRFFMAQSHYRSTLDFSNEALQAAEKGYKRLMESIRRIRKIEPSAHSSVNIDELRAACYSAMNDDFNSPVLIAHLFEAVRIINSAIDKKETLTAIDIDNLESLMKTFVFDILGLKDESEEHAGSDVINGLMELILDIRKSARDNKDWATSDKIRDRLKAAGVVIKDTKEGVEWQI
ncbi:Cysteine-tRNA ligase {ECO:0000255/HAMAP-Rule:MF_00041} [Petrimonas mucosa]|jgi:cysteinyl-tRNA synthetase|uniref:Cysteine--tRNA ligase n=1 Tax=Petrimonas mucosa TaxID=1642646 RepID=A0A1G4G418_9BACT|nr:Cysteine-tRNA ligase {ECO:0000255/HAMAP-Rule:MF_00041} [Petrimonas mucosa]SFU41258.1 cysteinyl-tRNA synthetase [Porphyromonadaceae bacterium KHP3R9]HHT29852.1 cysteine--tRNA ligase [Petrimonas mucosa]